MRGVIYAVHVSDEWTVTEIFGSKKMIVQVFDKEIGSLSKSELLDLTVIIQHMSNKKDVVTKRIEVAIFS